MVGQVATKEAIFRCSFTRVGRKIVRNPPDNCYDRLSAMEHVSGLKERQNVVVGSQWAVVKVQIGILTWDQSQFAG